jgi:hypothetical protein
MRARLPAMLAVLVVLAGCGGPDKPEPRATTTTTTTTGPPSRPAITRALDASAYRDRVCDLLTRAQIEDLDMSADDIPEQPDEHGRMRCSMDDFVVDVSDARNYMTLTYWYAADLLAAEYREAWYARRPLVPVTVAGQPALQFEGLDGDQCTIAIGFSDRQGLEVSFTSLDTQSGMDPCARAMEVGEDIVRNLAG